MLPGIYGLGQGVALIALIVLSIVITALSLLLTRNPWQALISLSSAFAVGVALDLLFGGYLVRSSILSYAASEGSRYYGIGNELMGAFLGASVLAISLVLGSRALRPSVRLILTGVLLFGLVILVGSPRIGANAGGAMAAVCGAVITLLVLAGRRLRTLEIISAGVGAIVVVAVLMLADKLFGTGQSHMGRAVQGLFDGNWLGFWSIAERKIAMNITLMSVSAWSKALMSCVCACLVLLLLPDSQAKNCLRSSSAFRTAAAGITTATVGALLLNDSGVVAAATCMVFLWALLLTVPEIKPVCSQGNDE